MTDHKVVAADQWLVARLELLAKEKEFTRLRDELTRQRRDLPWEKVEKDYIFDGPDGRESLADLFDGRSQLIVYHFMFDREWSEGCKSCSFIADHYDRSIVHLEHRDVSMVTVSRAPLEKLEDYKRRMGWSFKWVSASGTDTENDFNRDYQASFKPEEVATKQMYYNYKAQFFPSTEGPGISAFFKDDDGNVFHTYSSYGRGLDILIGAYNLLDLVPKGRDEAGLVYGMEWLRHHDRYQDQSFRDPYVHLVAARRK